MQYNKFLLALALCAGLQCNVSFSSEEPTETQPEPSYWQMYAPQFMRDTASATSEYIASWIPERIKNAVNKMSTKTKIAVATAIIGSLAAIYNRDAIMALVNNAMQPNTNNPEPPTTPEFRGTPEEFAKMQKRQEARDFENKVNEFISILGSNRLTGMVPAAPKQLKELYLSHHPEAAKDPAFDEALQTLRDVGVNFSDYSFDQYDVREKAKQRYEEREREREKERKKAKQRAK